MILFIGGLIKNSADVFQSDSSLSWIGDGPSEIALLILLVKVIWCIDAPKQFLLQETSTGAPT